MPRTQHIPGAAPLLLEKHLAELGLKFIKEYAFALPRKWRFDYVLEDTILSRGIAIEIEGGVWIQGRHTRGAGFMGDLVKYRQATATGWKVYRFSTQEVLDGTARAFIAEHCL